MILEMKVPSPGESITEVEIATWLVEDGDYVEKDQAIAEVDSDKATLELPAEASGTITLKKQDATTQAQMVLLSKGRPQIIAEGYDGLFRIFGLKNGVDVTVNTASGADMNEFNGYTLTLASKEDNLAYFVASSLISVGNTAFDVQVN